MFIVSCYIFVWYFHIFLVSQVVYPVINSEVKLWELHVGIFVVPNVAAVWDSVLLVQKVEGVPDS